MEMDVIEERIKEYSDIIIPLSNREILLFSSILEAELCVRLGVMRFQRKLDRMPYLC